MKNNNVLNYLLDTVQRVPNKIAFSNENSSLTFSELSESMDLVASGLIKKLQYKKPILVFMNKSPEQIAAFFGIIRSGNYYVPLDIDMSISRMEYIMDIINAEVMICDSNSVDVARTLGFKGSIIMYADLINGNILEDEIRTINEKAIDTDAIYVVFTSGSTGIPKGVVACHRSVIDYIEELSKVLQVGENTIFGNQAPLYLDACLKEIYPTIKFGATTYLIPKKLFMFPVKLIELLNEKKINTICWVVSALTLVSKLEAFQVEQPKFLKTIAFGGEVFSKKHFQSWKSVCNNARFINLYGPTECTGMSCYYVVDDLENMTSIPIGRPFPNTDIILLNVENQAAACLEKGEICIRGTGLTLGYYKNKEQTDKSFVINPLNNNYAELIYRTGDIGYFDEKGILHFSGRKDNQIKHMGYRIELEEIESVGNLCPKVTRSICLYNKEKSKICFIYEGDAKNTELKKYFKEKLAFYMVPSSYIQVDKIKVTSSGKVDRKAMITMLGEMKNE